MKRRFCNRPARASVRRSPALMACALALGVTLWGVSLSGVAVAEPEAAKPEAVKLDAAKPDAGKAEGVKAEGARPGGDKAEGARPEGAKADGAKAEGVKPESARPGGDKAESARPDGAKPEGARPDGDKAEGAKADGDKPDGGKPDGVKPDAARIYADQCAQCHGADRLGGQGPALLPESLDRLHGPRGVAAVIAKGRNATQMQGFSATLSKEDIAALTAYVTAPLASVPTWGEAEIKASREVHASAPQLSRPRFDADPLNLFVVVESGDHHATILDGDRFEPLARFETRYALHGGPKFTPDGRFVFFMSRDGWVSKYDLWSLTMLTEVRAGINSRNIAISRDGKHIAVANYLPHSLVILSTDDLSVEKIFDARSRLGLTSRVSAVYQAPTRNSFIAAMKDVPEIWEVSTDPNAEPVYSGMVHSYEKGMVEGLPSSQGLFALRRIEVSEPLDDFFFDPPYRNLIGSAREGKAIVVNLTVGREIKQLDLPGMPHLGSGITWDWNGRAVLATPLLKAGRVSVIDMADWSLIKNIETPGPGFFMRSHENTPYAWTDGMMGPKKDTLTIIDKRTLEVARSLTPEPGKIAAHVEFDRDGSHALVSIWEDQGALIVYDAKTFAEVKRLPMSKPSGKYNVWNKITFSDGTSH